jgi:hypothetical protein
VQIPNTLLAIADEVIEYASSPLMQRDSDAPRTY